MRIVIGMILVGMTMAASVHAAAPAQGENTHGDSFAQVQSEPHPVLPQGSGWAGSVLVVVGAMFAAAAILGPIVRAHAPREIPPTHSHDEPPGASGHHGRSGTIDGHH